MECIVVCDMLVYHVSSNAADHRTQFLHLQHIFIILPVRPHVDAGTLSKWVSV